MRAGDAPDRFLVGLATLSLLAGAVGDEPLVCLVDDAQWLDRVSAQTLEFVARRLLAESVLLVLAVRESGPREAFTDLRDLHVRGLSDRDSRRLLETVLTGPLDRRVRDRIVAETRGNPLALLELPGARSGHGTAMRRSERADDPGGRGQLRESVNLGWPWACGRRGGLRSRRAGHCADTFRSVASVSQLAWLACHVGIVASGPCQRLCCSTARRWLLRQVFNV